MLEFRWPLVISTKFILRWQSFSRQSY